MDKMLYVAMSGAKENMNALAVRANNLANANTVGFKSELAQARAMQAFGDGLPTRVFAMTESPSQNFDAGELKVTGNDLDIAINGDGWIAVQDANGKEAYTRAGNLKLTVDGFLETAGGDRVLSDAGPIEVPQPLTKISINQDGSIQVQAKGAPSTALQEVGRIKLVKPDHRDLHKGTDGLFRLQSGNPADADPTVSLIAGAVEGSNVNAVGEMTYMISLQRQYELQVKMMKTAEEADRQQNQLLRII